MAASDAKVSGGIGFARVDDEYLMAAGSELESLAKFLWRFRTDQKYAQELAREGSAGASQPQFGTGDGAGAFRSHGSIENAFRGDAHSGKAAPRFSGENRGTCAAPLRRSRLLHGHPAGFSGYALKEFRRDDLWRVTRASKKNPSSWARRGLIEIRPEVSWSHGIFSDGRDFWWQNRNP